MKRKLFSLLVLLLTAVTGAWADATIAKLWVGNSEEVTSEGTITGTGATEGTASVAIENGSMVLTLNNFKFNGCGYNDSGIYYQSNANGNTPLIIKIEGDNEITLPGGTDKSLYGFFLYGGNGDHVFTITGSGSLTVTVGDGNLSNGIFVQQADLVLAGGTVTTNVGNAGAEFKSLGVSVPQGTLTIDGGTLKASGSTTSASRGINVNNNVTIKSGELEAYGYTKGIKNSGGDALVFAEGVTPTLFKAGDNKASATDVSKYEGQKYLHVVCTGGDEPATDDTTVFELSGSTATTGTLTLGTTGVEVSTVKIHENTDEIAGIKMSNSYNLADGKYFTIKPATGSFKAGDKLSIAVCFNNADDTKNAKAAIYADDGTTLLYTTVQGINGRNSADDPAIEEYVLTQDADLLYIGRNGNTATFVTTLKVVRPASSGSGSGQEITGDAYALSVGENAQGSVKFLVGENEVTTAKEGETVTVVITPNTGWVVNKTSGQWIAAEAAARSSVPMLNGFELTKSTIAENTWSFTMERANAEVSVSYKKLLTNTDITVQDITALTYTGQAQEPTVTVKDGQTVLVKDVDYTVTYSNNINAALATAAQNAPTVTITAVATSEKYAGETTKKFTINKKALTVKADNKSVTFGDDAPTYTETYDGFVNNETKAVLSGTLSLTCSYVKNQSGAGTYDITPSGLTSSNYDITFTKGTLTVGKKALEDGFIANIASLVYTGVAQEPAPVVTFNGMTLVKGTDYSVSYENNVNVGTATATVTALANSTKYSGSASKTFSITKKALTVKADNKSVTFGDEAPAYTVSYDGFAAQENKDVLGGTLALACDYVKDQSGVGNYTITPSGYTSDNYAITFTKGTLTVGKKALEDGFIANIASLVYNGVAQEPAPVVTFNGMTLVKGTDYTVAYSNNTNAGTATVTCTGQGNYSGQAQKNFTIVPAVLTEATLKKTEFIFNAFDPQPQTAEVDVVKAGELIVPTTDYTVNDNTQTNLGDYKLTVTGKNNFQGSVKADFSIIKDDLPVTAEDTESGEEVDNVTIQVSVETDTETGEKTVIVDQLDVTPATSSQQVTVEIPSQINGVPVASIGAGALSAATNVSDIYMPETGETPIEVTDASLQAGDGKAIIHAPLQLLDNYAKMLPSHVGEKKVVSEVTQTAKRFWSFSCGVDVELPEGVTANIVKANTESQVTSEPIKGNVVKANNGVLLEGQQGVEYTLTAKAATGIGNDYEGNLLEPVIEKKHYGYGQGYYILKDGKFYAIANDAAAIPSCKAVLHIAGANARVISLVFSDETTGLSEKGIVNSEKFATATWYDLNGRKVAAPTKKGLYIMNGKKVVVK